MIIPFYCEDYPEALPLSTSSEDSNREKDEKHAEQHSKKGDNSDLCIDCRHRGKNMKRKPTSDDASFLE